MVSKHRYYTSCELKPGDFVRFYNAPGTPDFDENDESILLFVVSVRPLFTYGPLPIRPKNELPGMSAMLLSRKDSNVGIGKIYHEGVGSQFVLLARPE